MLIEIWVLVYYSILVSLGSQYEDRGLLFDNWVTYIFAQLRALLLVFLKALDFREKPCAQNEKKYRRELQEIYIFAPQYKNKEYTCYYTILVLVYKFLLHFINYN